MPELSSAKPTSGKSYSASSPKPNPSIGGTFLSRICRPRVCMRPRAFFASEGLWTSFVKRMLNTCWVFPRENRRRDAKTGEEGRHHADEPLEQKAVTTFERPRDCWGTGVSRRPWPTRISSTVGHPAYGVLWADFERCLMPTRITCRAKWAYQWKRFESKEVIK